MSTEQLVSEVAPFWREHLHFWTIYLGALLLAAAIFAAMWWG